ncbi:MAG: DUF488 family protein [Blastocatellia bacterium]
MSENQPPADATGAISENQPPADTAGAVIENQQPAGAAGAVSENQQPADTPAENTGPLEMFTIGHSNLDRESFIKVLTEHGIKTVVDVRNRPWSRYASQFNREILRDPLEEAGVTYIHMGDELGGRPMGEKYYLPDSRPNFEMVAATPKYLEHIDKLIETGRAARTVIMCSEGDYQDCHRYYLITRTLAQRDIIVWHIKRNGALARTDQSNIPPAQPPLFASASE